MSTAAQPVPPSGCRPFWLVAAALFVVTLLLGALRTGNLPITNSDEARFSEAAREMRQGGDWIVPHFDNKFRFDKPPLTYWCQAAIMAVLGENDVTARLHSALAAALLAVVIFAFGTRLFGRTAGFWAAVVFSTGYRPMTQATRATSDMLLTLFVTLAFWAGWELTRDRSKGETAANSPPPAWRNGWWWLYYVSLAIAFLAKGPVAWMPLLALPLYAWWAKPAALNRRFRLELGLPLMVGLLALWAVPAYRQTRGEFLTVGVGEHVITRVTQGYDGHGSANLWEYVWQSPVYFVAVFGSLIGWSTWFPWCFLQLRAKKFGGPTERYLLAGILVTFGILTLSWSRRTHYTLPAFPLIALLFAGLWCGAGRSRRVLAWVAAALAAFALLATPGQMASHTRREPARQLAERCAPYLRADSAFGAVELEQSCLVWYFRKYTRDFRHDLKPHEAAAFMAQPGPRFCLMERQVAEEYFPALPGGWQRIDAPGPGVYSGRERIKPLVCVVIKP